VFAVRIPHRGIASAFNDLLGGQTQASSPAWPRRCRTFARAAAGARRHRPVAPSAAESFAERGFVCGCVFKRLPSPDKQFTVLNGISHASFQQKNYKMVYQILHAYFTQPAPAYTDAG